jgi:hypothetical protein
MVYRDRELWGVAASGLLTLKFSPGDSGLARLDQFGKMFELWRLRRATLRYATAVGTTTAGAVYIGLDFDPDDLPTTLQGVQALTPLARIPCWEEGSVGVLTDRVNKAKWMYTSQQANHEGLQFGFAASIWNTGPAAAGEFWLDYEVELAGAASNQSLVNSISYMNTQSVQYLAKNSAASGLINWSAVPGFYIPGVTDSAIGVVTSVNALTSILPSLAGLSGTFTAGYAMLRGIGALRKGVIYDLMVAGSGLFGDTETTGYALSIYNSTRPAEADSSPALTQYGTDTAPLTGITTIDTNEGPINTTTSGYPISATTYNRRFTSDRDYSDGAWNIRIPLYNSGPGANVSSTATLTATINSVGSNPRSFLTY